MTAYLSLSLWFLAGAAIGAALLGVLAPRRPRPAAVALTALALIVPTAVFDSLMIAAGLFHYAPEHLLGADVGLAPVEDFAYPIAAALLLPFLWTALRSRRGAPSRQGPGEASR